mmetsp:Transcript_27619/g.24462  ORF Transcript_27619/g.24462 Transcript_27619/m.24462 type:complete len:180 (-) Transcript_27619:7-546(-)
MLKRTSSVFVIILCITSTLAESYISRALHKPHFEGRSRVKTNPSFYAVKSRNNYNNHVRQSAPQQEAPEDPDLSIFFPGLFGDQNGDQSQNPFGGIFGGSDQEGGQNPFEDMLKGMFQEMDLPENLLDDLDQFDPKKYGNQGERPSELNDDFDFGNLDDISDFDFSDLMSIDWDNISEN